MPSFYPLAYTPTTKARERVSLQIGPTVSSHEKVMEGSAVEKKDPAKRRKVKSRSHDAVIRVYDDAGNVIETHEHKGDFNGW